jgi:hypothetical protein
MARAQRTVLAAVLAAVVLVSGACGSTALLRSGHPGGSGSGARTSAGARPGHPPAASVAVIKRWARALQRGDVRAAARYFRIPSVFIDGPGPAITIRSLTQAVVANAALPCGAEFLSAAQHGPFVNVLFRLTGRSGPGGSSCGSGAGTTARTNFVIRSGRISVWLRAPDEPGDNGSPTGAPSSGGSVI